MNNNDNNQNNRLFNVDNLPDLGDANSNLNNQNNNNDLGVQNSFNYSSNNLNNQNNVNNNVVQEMNIYEDIEEPKEEDIETPSASLTSMISNGELDTNENVSTAPILDQKQSKKALKIVGIVIIALILVVGIVMFISYMSTNNSINNTRKNGFRQEAISMLKNVRIENAIDNGLCTNSGSKKVELNYNHQSSSDLNPFGRHYDFGKSYALIKYQYIDNKCKYEYYIYLTDGIVSIGTIDNPVSEADLNSGNFTWING